MSTSHSIIRAATSLAEPTSFARKGKHHKKPLLPFGKRGFLWRRHPDLNRGSRICSPMPYHLAMAPSSEWARCAALSAAELRPLAKSSASLPPFLLPKSKLLVLILRRERGVPFVYKFLFLAEQKNWSGRRGSNSLPPPWQGGALPDELRPHDGASGRNRTNDTRIFSPLLYHLSYRGIYTWWEQLDSNQ